MNPIYILEESSKHCQLLSLPSDVLLCCIAPYLCKWDQYQWFSTCTSHKSWLMQVRTVRISDCIPTIRDKMDDRHLSMNVYWWDRFVRTTDRQRLLEAVGCFDSTTNNSLRKLRLDITMNELTKHKALILDIASYLYQLNVDNSEQFENPTALAITRWLTVTASGQTFELIPTSKMDFYQIQKQVAALNIELGEPEEHHKQVITWNELRGANAVVINNDNQYTVDLGATAEMCLQSVTFGHCDTIVDVPDVPNVTLKYCKNITNFYVSSARVIHLVGMTVGDLSMLGNTKQLIINDCKVNRYPIPATGKGQAWEFSNVDIVDVSGLQSLVTLTLRDCDNVKDGSKLSNVQTLTIERGSMEHYPVPRTGKGQHWTLIYLYIVDVSGFASLESLTLIRCDQITDISMLGAVRYLTIEGWYDLYPKPVGRLQEWTFENIDMRQVHIKMFASLHHLTLVECKISDFLQVSTAINMKCFELSATNINFKLSVSIIGGKVVLEDKHTLRSAVYLWCNHNIIAKGIYGDIQNWDVRNVKDMSFVLYENTFNDNISTWDVSNVTDMSHMFVGASSFNQPLDSWNVSRVTNMSGMFDGASSFNQPLDSWNVSNATTMNGMFYKASSFNQPLHSWDVNSVTDMCGMFTGAFSFNKPLDNWNVSNVTDMSGMFSTATSFNQPLDSWDVNSVIDLSNMFEGASSFNQSLNSWDVSNVTTMCEMFYKASSFNQPLDSWNVSNVRNMAGMFSATFSFNQPLDSWDVSDVTTMHEMFHGASDFNQPLDSWNVSNVRNMSRMFYVAPSLAHYPTWYK